MPRFSKNGKPMGRTPATKENKHSRWDKQEDNYLALALKEGISAGEVANRLGRTKNSIYFRKLKLGLEGTFVRSKKKSKSKHEPKSKLVSVFRDENSQFKIFKLETGIPVPAKGGRTNEQERDQARSVLGSMNTGQSFVVPRRLVHVVRHLASKEFGEYKIRASACSGDKKFYRIFRLA